MPDSPEAPGLNLLKKPHTVLLLGGTGFLALLAIILRVYRIGLRPFHSDEGVNFHFVSEVLKTGYYPYSGLNYHGPSYFYFVTGAVKLFGDSELILRSVSIVSGLLTLAALIPLVRTEGRAFAILSLAFAAVSSSMVFHSRYAIHEMLLLCSLMWTATGLYLWLVRGKTRQLYVAAAGVAVAFATKETCLVGFAAIGGALCCTVTPASLLSSIRRDADHIGRAYLLFFILAVALFTGAFQNADALREFVRAIPQWTGRGFEDVGHFKPFLYYIDTVMWVAERPLAIAAAIAFVLAVLGIAASLLRTGSIAAFAPGLAGPLVRFSAVWMLISTLLYSSIKYKTPWIVINMTLPAILLTASVLQALLRSPANAARVSSLVSAAALFLSSGYYTLKYNFDYPWIPESVPYGPGNPYSYVHTSPGMLELIADVKQMWGTRSEAKVLIAVPQYWPLPYYLRAHPGWVGYYIPNDLPVQSLKHEIVVVEPSVEFDPLVWDKKYLRLSDVQEANVYFRKR